MVTELRTLRVTADMDASQYTSAAQQKVAADRQMSASGRQANAALGETGRTVAENSTKISQAGDILSRLSRQYVDGYASSQRFNQAINQLTRGVELGKIQMSEATVILDGIYRKYGLMADASRVAQRGQLDLARAIEQANAKLAAQRNIAPANMNRQGGLLGGVAGTATEGGQNFNAANAAYQFQDIAVTAAMGMSPLMIGLQQGTQLASVVSSMERPVAGLATAFLSLVSPVSLITIGLTAGAAALIQYFTKASEGSEEFERKFAKQAELIQNVASKWGDAYPALKAYADELQRTAGQADLAAGQAAAIELRYKQMGEALNGLVSIAPQVSRSLRDITSAEGVQAALAYEKAIADMRASLEGGKDPSDAFGRATQSLSIIIEQSGNEALRKYGEQFDILSGKMGDATRQAEAFRMQLPELGTLQGPWSEDGKLFYPEQFIPRGNVPVPQFAPNRESLEKTPDYGWVINPDGRLVPPGVPTRRPNYFERESDLPEFNSSAPYWSRDILLEEKRRAEVGGVVKSFITDFGTSLRSNSGDLGKALIDGLSNSMMNAATRAWDKFAQFASTAIVNAFMGQPSAGLLNKGIGFTGANTTLGQIVGAGGGLSVANDNVAGGFSGLAAPAGMSAYRAAISSIESGGNYGALGPITRNGDRAYGKYQVMGNNIGPWSQAALGRSVTSSEFLANPSLQDQIFDHRFGGYVSKYGASGAAQAWFGGPGSVGSGGRASDVLGTTGTAYVEKFNAALGDASKSVGSFGNGLGQIGQSLSTSFFPAAPTAASGGGGGGLFSWIGNLFGPNLSKYTGLTGLFADGTEFAPGGLAMVGERGREIVNLPRGSQVVPNHRTESMLAANGNRSGSGRNGPIPLNVNVIGANGDEHVRKLVEQGVSQALAAQNEEMVRTGFGEIQRRYAWQKA